MQLSDEKWKDYHLYDLFDIDTGNKFDRSKMTAIDPSVNFVGRSSTKNWVTAYVDLLEGVEPYAAGCMTIALGGEHIGSCFIQSHPFYTSQNVVVLTPKEPMSENVKIFISHVIRNESKNNYMAFARELNSHVKTDFVVKMPVLADDTPDYGFIEDYIEGLKCDFSSIPDYFMDEGFDRAFWYLDNIDQDKYENEYAGALSTKKELSERKWNLFKLGNIVDDIHNGKSYNAFDLVVAEGDDYIAYVTRTDQNNGISMYVQNDDYAGKEKAGAITIGDTTATSFYQPTDFITGPHIVVVRASWINIYTAQFIISLLNNERYRYPVFGRAFTKDLIQETMLYLPVDQDDNPDYAFMEVYIKGLAFSCNIE